jgi:hypothetical protein
MRKLAANKGVGAMIVVVILMTRSQVIRLLNRRRNLLNEERSSAEGTDTRPEPGRPPQKFHTSTKNGSCNHVP